jgi:hypothetical protein
LILKNLKDGKLYASNQTNFPIECGVSGPKQDGNNGKTVFKISNILLILFAAIANFYFK